MPNSCLQRRPWRRFAAAAFLLGIAMAAVAAPAGADDNTATGGTASTAAPSGNRPPVLAMPLEVARVTSRFATRRHPIKKQRHHHSGVDFAAMRGAAVRTVDDGVVAFAGTQAGYGNVIYIKHGGRDQTTLYAHLQRIDVRKGQAVRQGDTIGTVGSTGLATGPHLHFEVHDGGKPIDPLTLAYEAVTDPRDAREPDPLQVQAPDVSAASARCVDLLQKATLEALDASELESLRQGCLR